MADISAKAVMDLRAKTGAGMMDCKNALKEADGDVERAGELLRERGLAKAGKREGRATTEGAIGIAFDGASAGIVELGCETDFVAKTPDFQALATSLAGVAAGGASDAEAVMAGSVDGQAVKDRLTEAISKLGENIVVKRAARLAVDGAGLAGGYVHLGGKLGVVVGLRTDASGEAVAALAKDIAMHVAAIDPTPLAVDKDGIDADLIEKERQILTRQAEESGKPEGVIAKMVEGRLNKFFKESTLLEQPFVKDPDTPVKKRLEAAATEVGGDVAVSGFVRFKLGEDADA